LFLALAEAVERAVPTCLARMDAIARTFREAGVYPFYPKVVLARVPDVWPPPKTEKGQATSMQDIAGYRQVSPTYDQTEFVAQAREKEREVNALKMKAVLTELAADPLCQAQFAAKLMQLAGNSLSLFSHPQAYMCISRYACMCVCVRVCVFRMYVRMYVCI
jgi:hypothetical protein